MTSVETSSPTFRMTRGISALLSRVGDNAGQGRRGGHRRRREVDLGGRVPHPPLEVPVRRRDRRLAVSQRPFVDAEARAAARVHHDGAGGHEVAEVAQPERLRVDACRGREDEHARPVGHAPPAHDARRPGVVVPPPAALPPPRWGSPAPRSEREPMTTCWTGVPATAVTGLTLSTVCGQATSGGSSETSIATPLSYSASRSLATRSSGSLTCASSRR